MPDSISTLPYTQDIASCFAEKIGRHGLDRPTFDDYVARTAKALKRLRAAVAENSLPILTLPKREDEMRVMRDAAQRYQGLGHVIVLGTGGSSLGGKTVTALADGGLGSAGRLPGRPLLWFIENVDPWGFEKVVESVDLKNAGVIVISKSGSTAETLSQALDLLPRLEKAIGRETLQRRATVITEPTDNPLRRLAQRYGLPLIDHDPKVGGRYSVLSPTGMLPTLIAGLDAAKVRAGAQEALDASLDNEPARSPAAIGAALNIALAEKRGATQTVVMPYIDRLSPFGFWFRQLWAESLGKDGKGTTPIRAQGAVDQHSQLQLYLSGPADKLYTIIMGEARGQGPRYAKDQLGDKALDWLGGRTLGDLLDVSQRATAETLARNGRPVRVIRVPTLDERSLGALMMHYMLETIVAADLLGIDPFDQPAVEEGKKLARQYLAEMG
jgi:glucose-6-phosphate isomerase